MGPLSLLKRFSDITVWKQGGQRAPHKPLLVLYAIGKMLRGEGRLIPFADVDRDLKKLLIEFVVGVYGTGMILCVSFLRA